MITSLEINNNDINNVFIMVVENLLCCVCSNVRNNKAHIVPFSSFL